MAVCSTPALRKYLTQRSNLGQPLREKAVSTTRGHAEGEALISSGAYRRPLFKSSQDGRALAPTLADHRGQRGGTLGRAQGRSGWLMAGAHARPQAAPAGAGGAGQQDGPDRLGAAGARWGLSSSGRGGGLAVGPAARLSRGWKVRGRVWRYSRETGSGKPVCNTVPRVRGFDLDPIRELPSGPAA